MLLSGLQRLREQVLGGSQLSSLPATSDSNAQHPMPDQYWPTLITACHAWPLLASITRSNRRTWPVLIVPSEQYTTGVPSRRAQGKVVSGSPRRWLMDGPTRYAWGSQSGRGYSKASVVYARRR